MDNWPILSIVTFLPLIGVLFILMVRSSNADDVAGNARWIALWTSLAAFVISLALWLAFDTSTAGFQFVEKVDWIPEWNIAYHMGVDGISILFVLLSTLLTPICIIASWHVRERMREYMIAFLVLETMMVGTFVALDFVLFYVFFEGVLIPMFLIIGIWGGPRRVYSAFKFFLFTLTGSVLMLAAIFVVYFEAGTSDIPMLLTTSIPAGMQHWIWIAFFASFAVKMPMWP
ncbi:MAG: NADH-quinone oxidoreductase subunit M, partial [Alphaproteobacteria bacterium]|nr:NADH-quinone oxidoreductase subunit M [Alphaproteobacteria bacterium]